MPLGLYTLLFNAFVFVLMGLAFMILPASLVELVTDGIPQTPSGMIDVRATYGGGFAGIGLTLFATVLRQSLWQPWLLRSPFLSSSAPFPSASFHHAL